MDWMTFIVEILKATAWPLTAVVAIILLRKGLVELLPRIQKLKHKDTEIEFAKAIGEIEKKVIPEEPKPEDKEADIKIENEFERIMEVSKLSPRSAIMEAWLSVESSATKSVLAKYPEFEERKHIPPTLLAKLLLGLGLNKYDVSTFNELRGLRNQAVHSAQFEIDSGTIGSYVDVALSLARRIEKLSSNHNEVKA